MDEQSMMQQDQAFQMGRAAYINQDNNNMNTLLNDLTNVDIDIQEAELILQGIKINDEGKPEHVCDALCNKEGAANMGRLMRAMVGRITLMSNMEEDQIRKMVRELGYDIVEDLTFNKVRYEMLHPKAMSTIVDLVTMKALACGMQAMDNGTRQMLKKTNVETTINTVGQGIGKSKSMGSILGLGRK